jgi:hypothetical protein
MDGPHVGTAGDVGSAQWGSIADGANNLALPLVDVHVTTAPVVLKRPGPAGDVTLVTGTRLQIIEAWHPPLLNGTVKVMDGPHVGTAGDVGSAQWGSIADERS